MIVKTVKMTRQAAEKGGFFVAEPLTFRCIQFFCKTIVRSHRQKKKYQQIGKIEA